MINRKVREELLRKFGYKKPQPLYKKISDIVEAFPLTPEQAAYLLAQYRGIVLSKYLGSTELAEIQTLFGRYDLSRYALGRKRPTKQEVATAEKTRVQLSITRSQKKSNVGGKRKRAVKYGFSYRNLLVTSALFLIVLLCTLFFIKRYGEGENYLQKIANTSDILLFEFIAYSFIASASGLFDRIRGYLKDKLSI